jgi:hypothetical protein
VVVEVANLGAAAGEPRFGSVTIETVGPDLAALGVTVGSSGAGRRALAEGAGSSGSAATASFTGAIDFDSSDAAERRASA